MSEIPDIRQFDNTQFEAWAEEVAHIWRIDEKDERASIYDIFSVDPKELTIATASKTYGLYAAEGLVAAAGVAGSLFARDTTDRHLDILVALPGPNASKHKSALLAHAENGAFDDRYSTLTVLCTSYEYPFYKERGYKLFENDGGVIQAYKPLIRDNVTPVWFGRRPPSST